MRDRENILNIVSKAAIVIGTKRVSVAPHLPAPMQAERKRLVPIRNKFKAEGKNARIKVSVIKACQASWTGFVSVMSKKAVSVDDQQNKIVAAAKENNRKVLLSILDVIVTLGRQGMAFRGHRDHGKADNNNNMGNFYEMFVCVAAII